MNNLTEILYVTKTNLIDTRIAKIGKNNNEYFFALIGNAFLRNGQTHDDYTCKESYCGIMKTEILKIALENKKFFLYGSKSLCKQYSGVLEKIGHYGMKKIE